MELAASIALRGLIQPIVIRPCGEQENDPTDYDFVVVAGYRRYQAYRVNNHPVIPAVMTSQNTEMENRTLNFTENLSRKNLSLLEEAKGIQHYVEAGFGREQIAKELGKSPGWVQIRTMILELEAEVQAEFATDIFTTSHIRDLHTLRNNREAQLILAKKIKEARQRGAKGSALDKIINQGKKPKAMSKKKRSSHEIEEMMEHIYHTFNEYGLVGRGLAWAAGNIANYEFFQDIKEEALERGLRYTPPEFEL